MDWLGIYLFEFKKVLTLPLVFKGDGLIVLFLRTLKEI